MGELILVLIVVAIIVYYRTNNSGGNKQPIRDYETRKNYQPKEVYREERKAFRQTRRVGNLSVDEPNFLFEIRGIRSRTFSFNDVIKYELEEDGRTITSGGLSIGRALVGTVLAGGVGAIIGGVTGNKKSRDVVHEMNVVVTMRGANSGRYKINVIDKKMKKTSKEYRKKAEEAEEILSLFDIALDHLE